MADDDEDEKDDDEDGILSSFRDAAKTVRVASPCVSLVMGKLTVLQYALTWAIKEAFVPPFRIVYLSLMIF